jgi:hypothetical protein
MKMNRKKRERIRRKGMEPTLVVGLVVIALTLIVFFAWYINSRLSELPASEACHEAVVYRASLYEASTSTKISEILQDKAVNMIILKCRTKMVVIDSADKTEIIGKIADEMAACWGMLGGGKANFFGRAIESSNQQCVQCAVITFSTRAKNEKIQITTRDLSEYMAKTPMPGKEDAGITYTDYFAGSTEHLEYQSYNVKTPDELAKKTEAAFEQQGIDMSTINTASEGYSIIYTMWERRQLESFLASAGISVTATIAGAVACYGLAAALSVTGIGAIIVGAACTAAISTGGVWVGSQASSAVDTWQGAKYVAGMTIVPNNAKGMMSAGGKGKAVCSSFNNIPT